MPTATEAVPPATARRLLDAIAHSRLFLPVCFGLFVALRLAILLLLPLTQTSDADWYVESAMRLAAGAGYTEAGVPTAYWPIGYPLFLAAVFILSGPHVLAAQLANLALSCGIFVLTWRIAGRLLRNETGARLAVLLLTFYPNQIAYTGVLFSETCATFVLLLACDVFIARPAPARALASGVLFGAGALIKAQFLLLPAILLLLHGWGCWRDRRQCRRTAFLAIAFAAGMAAAVLPVTARNYLALGRFVLISTNGGPTFLTGNNPAARGNYTGDALHTPGLDWSPAGQVDADHRAYALGLDWIRHDPWHAAALVPLKVWRLWAPDGDGEWWFQRGYAGYDDHILAFRIARGINQLYYAALLAGAAAAVLLIVRRPGAVDRWMLFGVMFAAYLTLISIVYSGQSRFHIPAMPFVMIYDAWLLLYLARRTA